MNARVKLKKVCLGEARPDVGGLHQKDHKS